MEKETVIRALQTPYKRPLDFALTYANLTKNEDACLRETIINGNTEERAAEILGYSRDFVTRNKKKAIDKLCRAWDFCEIIPVLLSY